MSEESTAPAGDSAVSAPESGSSAAGSGVVEASAGPGNAPGAGGDVVAGEGTPAVAAETPAQAKFRLLNREFNDQKHAETVLSSELTRARQTQRELAELKKQTEQYQAEINALRAMAVRPQGGTPGQGAPRGPQSSGGPKSFAKELAENGELEVIAKIAADPEMGLGHAMYRMAELLDERNSKQVGEVREEIRAELQQQQVRSMQERAVAKAIGSVRTLAADYPELDENNQSEEAIEAQQAILGIIKALPQGAEWLANEPEEALRYAAERYRRTYGTPVFAQPPGTSGSPSVRAAAAAEAAAQGSVATPLDGSGTPRQRPNGQPETPQDRMRRENREATRKVTTPSGRVLWDANL
jgi:hypothetical protein